MDVTMAICAAMILMCFAGIYIVRHCNAEIARMEERLEAERSRWNLALAESIQKQNAAMEEHKEHTNDMIQESIRQHLEEENMLYAALEEESNYFTNIKKEFDVTRKEFDAALKSLKSTKKSTTRKKVNKDGAVH